MTGPKIMDTVLVRGKRVKARSKNQAGITTLKFLISEYIRFLNIFYGTPLCVALNPLSRSKSCTNTPLGVGYCLI